jgi:hypothetical protein
MYYNYTNNANNQNGLDSSSGSEQSFEIDFSQDELRYSDKGHYSSQDEIDDSEFWADEDQTLANLSDSFTISDMEPVEITAAAAAAAHRHPPVPKSLITDSDTAKKQPGYPHQAFPNIYYILYCRITMTEYLHSVNRPEHARKLVC